MLWLDAATAIAAYRERYEVPEHTPMLGAQPAASRPEARAAWDHAREQADHYLARRLRNLDDHQLADLDTRLQAVIDNAPTFDPAKLEHARRRLDATRSAGAPPPGTASREELLVARLERAAQTHRHWRRAATHALDTRRQIAHELDRRHRQQRIRPPVLRMSR